MLQRLFLLLAVAGLLVLVYAGPNADLATPAKRPGGQQAVDSVRTLPAKAKGVELPPGIDVNDVIRRASRGPKPEPPPEPFGNPFTEDEFMPAPTIVPKSYPGRQDLPSAAFDGTNYLVVWIDDRNGDDDIYGARVTPTGSVLDPDGIAITPNTPASNQYNPSVAFDGTDYLVVWEDTRNGSYNDIYGARVSPTGSVLDPSGIAISPNTPTSHQFFPSVAFDGTNYLVVWEDGRNTWMDIYGARVSKNGTVLDAGGILVSTNTPTSSQLIPAVAFGGTNYLVVWRDTRNDAYGDIYGARVSKAGAVLDASGIAITPNTPTSSQMYPSVAFDGTNYLVVWYDDRNGPNSDIYGTRVSKAGAVLDASGIAITPNTPTSGQQYASVAFDGNNYLVVWQDYRNGSYTDIYGARVSQSGSVLDAGGILVSTNTPTSYEDIPSVAFDGSNYLVIWTEYRNANRDIYGARVSPTGTILDPYGIIVTGSVNTQTGPAVAFDGTNYLVVWQDNRNGNYDICGARVAADGALLDLAGFAISTNTPTSDQRGPSVAFDGTRYLVVWLDSRSDIDGDIYGARVSQSGSVLDPTGIAISTATGGQIGLSVAFDGTNFLVVWQDSRDNVDWDIYGARVSQSGSVLDPAGIAISAATNNEAHPSVAFDGTNYLVVWHDLRRNVDWDIYGARVSQLGSVLDPNGIAISTATGWQYHPSVAFDGANYLAVWGDNRSNASMDIYGARVAQSGSVLDPNGIAISTATGHQQGPSVAFDGTNYLAVWMDQRNGGLDEIYGCLVDPAGLVVEEYVVSTQSGDHTLPAVACGPGTALATSEVPTGTVGGVNYSDAYRIWARLGALTQPGDVGTDSILRPVASFLMPSWKIPPLVRVKNFGSVTQGPFDVRFTIGPGSYTSTKTVLSLAAGDTCAVEFDSLTLDYGVFTAKCSTMLAGDLASGNDARTAYFQGCDDVLYSDTMSDNYFAVSPSGTWALGDPTSPWTLPPMDASAWGYQLDGTKYYNGSTVATLTSPEYTALQDHPAIAFQHSFNTEPGVDGGDFSYSTNSSIYDTLIPSAGLGYGGVVTALGDSGWSGTSTAGWNQSVFTLTHVTKDSPFWIRWRFASDGSNNNYHGWLIDEVGFVNHDPADGRKPSGRGSVIDTLSVWPNLVRGPAQVNYTLVKDCNVSIKLYDASGRLAARVPTNGFKKGKNTARLDASRLSRGVYFLKLEGAGDVSTTKVIIE
ncbi:MAG: T9SS type A sorting domain-containing protein [candidate division WOR-3 bacterium]|nr:T9SS type A sorting domain-containing protein [candidate division WOR-3 bacterium]